MTAGDVGWNLRTSEVDRDLQELYTDVPVSRNWYKTESNLYENSYI